LKKELASKSLSDQTQVNSWQTNLQIERKKTIMNTKRFFALVILLSLTATLLLGACAPTSTASSNAVEVVQKYYNAVNSKDIDLAMSYIASDAVFANPTGKYASTAEIRASLEGVASDGITFELSNFRDTNGRVVYDYKVMMGDQLLDQGTNGLTIVKDGKIVFDGTEDTFAVE
jgi:limonene-1,2-epoxide hydrolase